MTNIKVSQATIDKIKTMGMTKALKGASNANPEMKEALTRMYGAKRVAAASGSKPAAKSADAARSSVSKAMYKSADSARSSTTKTSSTKAPVKKSGTTDPFAKAVFSAGRAIASGKLGASGGKTAAEVAAINKARASGTAMPSGKLKGIAPTVASVAAENAKRLGISVAEYNRRSNAKKSK
jgi:hypothetical protein